MSLSLAQWADRVAAVAAVLERPEHVVAELPAPPAGGSPSDRLRALFDLARRLGLPDDPTRWEEGLAERFGRFGGGLVARLKSLVANLHAEVVAALRAGGQDDGRPLLLVERLGELRVVTCGDGYRYLACRASNLPPDCGLSRLPADAFHQTDAGPVVLIAPARVWSPVAVGGELRPRAKPAFVPEEQAAKLTAARRTHQLREEALRRAEEAEAARLRRGGV
jgi:hypothetical protein